MTVPENKRKGSPVKKTMSGSDFRALRKKMDLTETELGQILGMSQQMVNRLENERGQNGPTKQQAAGIRIVEWLHRQDLLDAYRATLPPLPAPDRKRRAAEQAEAVPE